MTELQTILREYDEAHRRGAAVVLATVVHVQGSTFRRPGARMLLTSDGRSIGAISGGCLEKEMHRKAWWMTQACPARLVRYDTRSGEDAILEFGLGCQGVVDVLLERFEPAATAGALEFSRTSMRDRTACVIATVICASPGAAVNVADRVFMSVRGDVTSASPALVIPDLIDEMRAALHEGRSRSRSLAIEGAAVAVFIELIAPPPELLICGAGHDAAPLARMARALGWDAVVIDPRAAIADAGRFSDANRVVACRPEHLRQHVTLGSRTVAVVMSHNMADDRAFIVELLRSDARYIGILGPRDRTDALRRELAIPENDPRIFAPVGLDIGAECPAEIALAIVAEIQALRTGHPGGHLRDRIGPIHRPPLADASLDAPIEPPAGATEGATCRIASPS